MRRHAIVVSVLGRANTFVLCSLPNTLVEPPRESAFSLFFHLLVPQMVSFLLKRGKNDESPPPTPDADVLLEGEVHISFRLVAVFLKTTHSTIGMPSKISFDHLTF